jgi:actin related protein 2/3 complex subunit 1A/1B
MEAKSRPGLAGRSEESALNMFRQMDLKGQNAKNDTKLTTVHQNTVNTIRVYQESGSGVTKFSSSGVDGRVVVWSV